MPPKRKSDAATTAEPRRSSRTVSAQKAPEPEKPAKKVTKKAKQEQEAEPESEGAEAQDDLQEQKVPNTGSLTESSKADEPQADEADQPVQPAAKKTKIDKIKVGDKLPQLSLKDDAGKEVSLLDEAKEQGIVLFSYPAANTPGCTSQACSYRDRYEEVTKRGFRVFGISTDTVAAQGKFKAKHTFNYPLLSDPKKELLGPLGGSSSAKPRALRCHWVFSAGGTLEAAELEVKPKDCVNKALASIDKIQSP